MSIDPAALDRDPFRQFDSWLTEARNAGLPHPDSFALATAGADGSPSVRMLLLRGHGPDGFRFCTNRASRKGRDLTANPRGAALFHWPELGRQVRVAGPIEPLDERTSTEYFATRPRASQLSAWVSRQGAPVPDREALEAMVAEADARFPDGVPLPADWGGYRLLAERIEFWLSRDDRLHDRVEYLLEPDGTWSRQRLQP